MAWIQPNPTVAIEPIAQMARVRYGEPNECSTKLCSIPAPASRLRQQLEEGLRGFDRQDGLTSTVNDDRLRAGAIMLEPSETNTVDPGRRSIGPAAPDQPRDVQ